jgi:hypothetical protein
MRRRRLKNYKNMLRAAGLTHNGQIRRDLNRLLRFHRIIQGKVGREATLTETRRLYDSIIKDNQHYAAVCWNEKMKEEHLRVYVG